jgi:hypothetical protein
VEKSVQDLGRILAHTHFQLLAHLCLMRVAFGKLLKAKELQIFGGCPTGGAAFTWLLLVKISDLHICHRMPLAQNGGYAIM